MSIRSNQQLRQQVTYLRKEAGQLMVKDRDRVNIVAVPTHEEFKWKWRLYAPKGTTCDLGMRTNDVSTFSDVLDLSAPMYTGHPLNASNTDGILVVASVSKHPSSDALVLALAIGDDSKATSTVSLPPDQWLTKPAMKGWAGRNETTVHEYDKPIVLYAQMQGDAKGAASTDSPRPGLMFWLTPRSSP